MKNILKSAIICLALVFVSFGIPVLAEEIPIEVEEEKDIELLLEKVQELVEILEEMEKSSAVEDKCDYYLTEYIRYGAENNPEEVKKLQIFLNEHEGEQIPVTGFYGEITLGAVNRLQKKYAEEILAPWGITEPTGYVYITTQRFINSKKCNGADISLPALVVDSTIEEDTGVVAGEAEGTEEKEEEEIEDSEWINENWEELRAEDEEDAKRKKDTLTWIVVILGSVGLGIVIYNIYTFNPKGSKKE